jgi:hypothetical protein
MTRYPLCRFIGHTSSETTPENGVAIKRCKRCGAYYWDAADKLVILESANRKPDDAPDTTQRKFTQ